jgi:hypothetical protein
LGGELIMPITPFLVVRAAFDALQDEEKFRLLDNVLLREELAIQKVGMDNLM